jgi:hypothetical protein
MACPRTPGWPTRVRQCLPSFVRNSQILSACDSMSPSLQHVAWFRPSHNMHCHMPIPVSMCDCRNNPKHRLAVRAGSRDNEVVEEGSCIDKRVALSADAFVAKAGSPGLPHCAQLTRLARTSVILTRDDREFTSRRVYPELIVR